MSLISRAVTLAGAIVLLASTVQAPHAGRATASLGIPPGPFLPGSRIPLRANGLRPPYDLTLIGPGTLHDNIYIAPDVATAQTARLIAGGRSSLGIATIALAPAPARARGLIAVAAYDGGVVLHDPTTFARIGVIATGGSPGDVAFGHDGSIASADTAGDAATIVARSPWKVTAIAGVPLGNEIAIASDGTIFVSNRDVAGAGALTRIVADGSVMRVVTGLTAEGLAIDDTRGIVYVGNVNDATVLAVDAKTMKPLRRIPAVPRLFGIALAKGGKTLYVVANRSKTSPFAQPGFVAAIALGARPRIAARSANLVFPLGVAIDDADNRLFVTDESAGVVYVLDPKSLRPVRTPLSTCSTPWKPHYDVTSHRLFVPCARADKVDVFDARTLERVAGAPFATGAYPLGISTWP